AAAEKRERSCRSRWRTALSGLSAVSTTKCVWAVIPGTAAISAGRAISTAAAREQPLPTATAISAGRAISTAATGIRPAREQPLPTTATEVTLNGFVLRPVAWPLVTPPVATRKENSTLLIDEAMLGERKRDHQRLLF